MRTQAEWNVIAHTLSAPRIPNDARRSRSSPAALLVKVTAKTDHGAAGSTAHRRIIRARSSAVGCCG